LDVQITSVPIKKLLGWEISSSVSLFEGTFTEARCDERGMG